MTAIPRYVWEPSTEEVARRAGIDPAAVIRADQNTSPFTPPWVAEVAAAAAPGIAEYPAPEYRDLRQAIAAHVGADPGAIVPGAGADEMILLVARALLGPGAVAVGESPGYAMHRIATLQAGADFREVPRLLPDLAFPASALTEAARDAALTWLCVPHNPIGDRPSDTAIAPVVAAADGTTVIDAAYAELVGDTWGAFVAGHDDVVVLGTLSKAFALAGGRVGYAIAPPALADALDALRPPSSISGISVALALRALAETGWMEEHVGRVIGLRDELAAGLRTIGLQPRPSVTNFVLVPIGERAAAIADSLLDRGIVVRSFGPPHPLADWLRLSVRTATDQERMLAALHEELR